VDKVFCYYRVGRRFEQTLDLGFPLGKVISAETVGTVIPQEQVMWWKDEKGMKPCHLWKFESLGENRTRIINVEVFHGTLMGLIKPLIAGNWQRRFEQAVAGLITQAQVMPERI